MDEKRGEREAEEILDDLGFDSLPIKPSDVANAINLDDFELVMESQSFSSENILGKAIGNTNGAVIYINSKIPDEGRYNFTAAHELGHVCLHIMSDLKGSFECGYSEIYNQYDDPLEKEANGFAAGLLMPSTLINKITDNDINWFNIKTIADKCDSSLEATFRRLIRLYREPIALVIHKKNQFKRFVISDQFEAFIGNSQLTEDQLLNRDDGLCDILPTDFETTDADDWVSPYVKGENLSCVYVSSIALKNNITYTLIKYDEECFE